LTRFETLAHIDADWIAAAFVCAAAFSRGCAALVMATLPDAHQAGDADDRIARPATPNVGTGDALIALGIAVAPLLILTAWTGDAAPAILGLSFALLATAFMRRLIRRRLAGPTHECLGAVQQAAEAAFLIGLLVVLGASVDELAFEEDDS
jgi:adenosylcobinamide-GDP ribazoletransferase